MPLKIQIALLQSDLAGIVRRHDTYSHILVSPAPDAQVVFRLNHHHVWSSEAVVFERSERRLIVDVRTG
jgi:hypothetical protein